MPYGKYKGLTLEEIADVDMGYLWWCLFYLEDRNLQAKIERFLFSLDL